MNRGMLGMTSVLALVLMITADAAAVTITFDAVARKGDPVPGQPGASGFTTLFGRPSINDAGVAVFEGLGPVSFGLYAKQPGLPLAALVDGTQSSPGVPTFPVPGHPGAFFGAFKPPLINNQGDVVFFAEFSGGRGIFATNISGGPIVNLMDDTTAVPGFPGTLFHTFGFTRDPLVASLDNAGNVVIRGEFLPAGAPFILQGLYATTVSGGPLLPLVDSAGTFGFTPSANPNHDPSLRVNGIGVGAALTDTGHVVFNGTSKFATASVFRTGVFSVPLDGSSLPTIVALQFDAIPTSLGSTAFLGGSLSNFDVTEGGTVVLHAADFSIFQHGIYAGSVTGGPLALVVDNAGGFAVPGRPAGVNFTSMVMSAVNDSGQLGFFSFDNNSPANNGGFYATDLSAAPPALVANTFGIVPPGRTAPTKLGGFTDISVAPPINAGGNITFGAVGDDGVINIFGLYFYDSCTATLVRVADDVTAPTDLGGSFFSSGNRGFEVHAGLDVRSGLHRAINAANDIAFLVRFANFDAGVYIAHVAGAGAGGGGVAITCPADTVVECGSSSDPGITGSATAAGGCSGASVPTTFSDVVVPGVGGTETIARTWTADDGAGNVATCNQIISVVDSIAPTLAGVPADASAECDAVPAPANPTVSDTCDPAASLAFAETQVNGACANQFTLTRTWTATDGSNNVTTQSQTVSVDDTTPPSLVGVPADAIVECDAIPAAASVSAVDNCDAAATVSFSEVQTGACVASATLTRTWSSVDACGNASSATQVITVQDTTPPIATAGLTLLSGGDVEGSGNHDDDEGIFAVTASCSDNCDGAAGCAATTVSAVLTCSNGVSVAVTPGQFVEIEDEDEGDCEIEIENGRLEIEGRVTLTVTCTDAAGNMSTATALPVGLAVDNDSELDFDD